MGSDWPKVSVLIDYNSCQPTQDEDGFNENFNEIVNQNAEGIINICCI